MEELNESLVAIDEFRLDRELKNQPKLFMRYALLLAGAKQEVANYKAALDVAVADLNLEIRNDPIRFKLPKVTESTIESCIKIQPQYANALKKLNRAKYRMDMYQAAVDALEHRKKALEGLVYLQGQNYFSAPKMPKGSVMTEEVKREIRNKGKRSRDE